MIFWVVLLLITLAWRPLRTAVRLIVRAHRSWSVLCRMPHVPSPGLLGWTECLRDTAHAPHIFSRAANERGGLCAFRTLFCAAVVVTDPALAQQVLVNWDLPKSKLAYKIFNMATSPNGRYPHLLGHYKHDGNWRLVRKGIAPAFSPKNLRERWPGIVGCVQQACDILAAAGPSQYLDLADLVQRLALDVMGKIGFDIDFGATQGFNWQAAGPQAAAAAAEGAGKAASAGKDSSTSDEAVTAGQVFDWAHGTLGELAKRWIAPWRTALRHITPDARRGERVLQEGYAGSMRFLKQLQARGVPSADDTSIAAHLLRVRDPRTGLPPCDEQLSSDTSLLLVAGFETTGNTIAWTLYFLATHPEVESKVCAELDTLGLLATPSCPTPRPMEYTDIGKLTYLSMVIKESMRLVPAVGIGSARVTDREVVLGGYTIPKGVLVMVPIQGVHTNPHCWERPDEFLPERWEEPGAAFWQGPVVGNGGMQDGVLALGIKQPQPAEGTKGENRAQQQPRRFIPFSDGVRSCIGQTLANMEMAAAVAMLVSRFSFELPPELRAPGALWDLQCFRTTTQPANGLPLKPISRLA